MITADTKILTKLGLLTVDELDARAEVKGLANSPMNLKTEVLCPATGAFKTAWIEWAQPRPVWTYTLSPYYNQKDWRTWEFQAPRPCCFPLVGGAVTYDLRLKDVLCANSHDCGYVASAWLWGFMYRFNILNLDSLDPKKYPLHADKLRTLKASGEIKSPVGLPCGEETVSTKGSFLKGYLAADKYRYPFSTNDEALAKFFIENHTYAGLILTGSPRKQRRTIKVDKVATFYDEHLIAYSKGAEFPGFKVIDITGPSESEVEVYSVRLSQPGDYVINGGWTGRGD